MWYTDEQKIDIGRSVFTHEMTRTEACEKYGISYPTVINYVKFYMAANNIPLVPEVQNGDQKRALNYKEMSKDELINELMKKDIEIARTKKGYAVKGGGKEKEYITLNNQNTK